MAGSYYTCPLATTPFRLEPGKRPVGLARKGWLEKSDVINTLPLEKLRKELAKKRK